MPDLLVVIGTSLKVYGVQQLVKDFSKSVKRNSGQIILINNCSLGREWENLFDYILIGDCDKIFKVLKDLYVKKQISLVASINQVLINEEYDFKKKVKYLTLENWA